MPRRVTILGAGFAGLELATRLSEALGERAQVTLIDRNDGFSFGYSKLDVMFGRATPDAVWLPYAGFSKPGVTFRRETVTAIEPATRRVTTDRGEHDADILVIAMGADYDLSATPGLAERGHEFYTLAGATRLRGMLPAFAGGDVVVGICGAPYKCPPAPSEASLLVHDLLVREGRRERSTITLVSPLPAPVPPSPETSAALLTEFAARGITFMSNRRVVSLDADAVALDDGTTLPCRLFLGVPKHVAPRVLRESGMTEGDWVTADPRTLETKWPGVYAVGDVANTGVPKAGAFAESAAIALAETIIARLRGKSHTGLNPGRGHCYIEFGAGQVASVEVDFFTGPTPVGTFHGASVENQAHKARFGSSRSARWFGRQALS